MLIQHRPLRSRMKDRSKWNCELRAIFTALLHCCFTSHSSLDIGSQMQNKAQNSTEEYQNVQGLP